LPDTNHANNNHISRGQNHLYCHYLLLSGDFMIVICLKFRIFFFFFFLSEKDEDVSIF
jgi:hypothetical protein